MRVPWPELRDPDSVFVELCHQPAHFGFAATAAYQDPGRRQREQHDDREDPPEPEEPLEHTGEGLHIHPERALRIHLARAGVDHLQDGLRATHLRALADLHGEGGAAGPGLRAHVRRAQRQLGTPRHVGEPQPQRRQRACVVGDLDLASELTARCDRAARREDRDLSPQRRGPHPDLGVEHPVRAADPDTRHAAGELQRARRLRRHGQLPQERAVALGVGQGDFAGFDPRAGQHGLERKAVEHTGVGDRLATCPDQHFHVDRLTRSRLGRAATVALTAP